jgi:hypothetical protein
MGFVRKIGRKIDKEILQPIKHTVEAVLDDPRKLAMVALSVFAPGVGTAIGSAMGLSGTAAAIIGNTAVNTVLNGGDVKAAIFAAAIPVVGREMAGLASNAFIDAGMDKALADTAGNVTSRGLLAAAQGKDPVNALISGGLNAGTDAVLNQIPGFEDLDPSIKKMTTRAVANTLVGNNALSPQDAINAALNIGMKAVDRTTDEEGNYIENYFRPGGAGYIDPENLEATVKQDEGDGGFMSQFKSYLPQTPAEFLAVENPTPAPSEPPVEQPMPSPDDDFAPTLPSVEPPVEQPMPSPDDDFVPTVPPSEGGGENVFDPTFGGTLPLPTGGDGTPGGASKSPTRTTPGTKPAIPGAKTGATGNPAVDAITNLANQQQQYQNSVLNMMMNDKNEVANIKSFKDLYGGDLFGGSYVPPSALGMPAGGNVMMPQQNQDEQDNDFFDGGHVDDIDVDALLRILRS